MAREKGSALITAILVVLVLTMVGLASVLYMTLEDRVSNTDSLSKAALYAAELGIRRGEQAVRMLPVTALSTVLGNDDAANDPYPISGLTASDLYGTEHLGTAVMAGGTSGAVLVWEELPTSEFAAWYPNSRIYYSLYLRNNPNDHLAGDSSYLQDHDGVVNLICRGIVTDPRGYDPGNPGAVRILFEKVVAEQLMFSINPSTASQFRLGQGGLSSSQY